MNNFESLVDCKRMTITENFILIAFVLFSCLACDKEETEITFVRANYSGTFIRTSPVSKFRPAEVTLSLIDSTFEGSSNIEKYPTICKGTFSINADEITFNNECMFTADFDWNYILSGKFKFYYEGEELIITRSYEGSVTDMYRLTRSVN